MRTTLRRITVLMSTAILATSLALTSVKAESIPLTDVKSNHWAYSTIQWAVNKGVVKGYPDGTFKPSKNVSEAEFLMMFISAYQEVSPTAGQTHWADPVYDVAYKLNWQVKGVNNNAVGKAARDMSITRGEVANIIAGANGINYMGNDAIQYLLNKKLSSGKTGDTVEGYKANDCLTRAEAVVFIKRAIDQGLAELKVRPEIPSSSTDIPKLSTGLPADINTVKTIIDKFLGSNGAYAGYSTKATETGVAIKGANGTASASYGKALDSSEENRIISFNAASDADLKLAVKMLQTVGVPVPDSFVNTLKNSALTGEAIPVKKYGNYNVFVTPDFYTINQVTVSFKLSK